MVALAVLEHDVLQAQAQQNLGRSVGARELQLAHRVGVGRVDEQPLRRRLGAFELLAALVGTVVQNRSAREADRALELGEQRAHVDRVAAVPLVLPRF